MKRNAVEWLVLVASVLAIVALVGLLVAEGLRESEPPAPTVELRLDEARQAPSGWIVPATVSNAGDRAAQAVVIEATATIAGSEETSELEVDFLPAGSSVEVAFAFSAAPDGEIAVRLVSFREP